MKFNYKNISQEEMDKLPQLDRIELRQKRDWLEHNKIDMGAFSFLNMMLIVSGLLLLTSIILLNLNIASTIKLLESMFLVIRIGIYGFLMLFIFQIAANIKHRKQMTMIHEYYFEQKTEVKRKK